MSKRYIVQGRENKGEVKEAGHDADLESLIPTLTEPSMATVNQDHPSAGVRPNNTIELDDNVVQKLAESNSKFVNLSSEAKASCDSYNPSLCVAFIAKQYRSVSQAAMRCNRYVFLLTTCRQPQMLSVQ